MGSAAVETEQANGRPPGARPAPSGAGYLWYAFWPVLRATAWGLIGFGIGAGSTAFAMGQHGLNEPAMVTGYILGLVGWLLGAGAWEAIARPFFGGSADWDEGVGWARYLRLNTDHKVIGLQTVGYLLLVFGVAGIIAMTMRVELMNPKLSFFQTKQQYNEFMSIHGTLMLFVVSTVPIFSGLGHYFVPLMIGARRMVFPRLEALSFWLWPAGVAAICWSPAVGGYQLGWTGYEPAASVDQSGQIFYALGAATVILATTLTAINIIGTIIFLRAPGLTWSRLPIFIWAELATAFLAWLWFAVIAMAMTLQISDRVAGTNWFRGTAPLTSAAFDPVQHFAQAGKPIIWQDLFWGFSHPEVYIIMIPAWGIWLEILPVLTRKTLFAYRWAVGGILGVTFLSSYVWTHHMFVVVSQSREIPFMTTTELISIPTSLMYMVAIGTLWKARAQVKTPLLLVLFSMLNFLIGGISGTFLADVPVNYYVHDTFFVVAHFHYTILGGMVFAWVAAMYWWLPKWSGRMYDERIAKFLSWWIFVFFNWTFFSMFLVGLNGMNRRVATYPQYLGTENFWISVPAWFLGAGFIAHAVYLIYCWRRGERVVDNPWESKTLEWQIPSPPPLEDFQREPVVVGDFYGYGEPGPEPGLLPVPGIEEIPPPRRRPPAPVGGSE